MDFLPWQWSNFWVRALSASPFLGELHCPLFSVLLALPSEKFFHIHEPPGDLREYALLGVAQLSHSASSWCRFGILGLPYKSNIYRILEPRLVVS